MYSKLKIKSRVRVAPKLLGSNVVESVEASVKNNFIGSLDPVHGLFLDLINVDSVGDGVIIPGDGAVYYDAVFNILAYKPIVQELVEGVITEVAEFGAFAKIGPIEGLIHKSQVMDDFISYSKTGVLAGKESNNTLKVGDKIIARVIASNMKNLQTAKIGLTMRQSGLGVPSWFKKKDNKTKSKKESDK